MILSVCAAVLVTALAAAGILLWPNAPAKEPDDTASFSVDLVTVIPPAYMGEQYDLKRIIEMQDGVEYSAQVFYQNYDTMEEVELPVTDLVFCQTENFDVNVLFTAKRGTETAQKALDIPVLIRADEIDEMFSTSGMAGWAETGVVKNLSTDPNYLSSETSKTSLAIAYQGTPDHEYGLVVFSMAKEAARPLYTDQIWENAAVTFWVYNPMEQGIEFQLRLIDNTTGLDTDWSNEEDADNQIALPGQWTQIVFSLRKYGITKMLTNQKDQLAVKMQYLGRPALGEQYAYSMYIDEIDIVDASAFPELDTKPVVSNETIEQGWENIRLDTGWQTAKTIYDYETIQGEGSSCSLYAQFPETNTKEGYFVALSPEWSVGKAGMKKLPDMTGGTLTGYFKFKNATPAVEVYLTKKVNNKWQTSNTLKMTLENVGDGWYKGTLDVYDFEFTTDRNDEIIRICFAFTGAAKGAEVWMDTVKFAPKDAVKVKESAQKDWINLPTDSGMSNVVRYSYTPDYKKAEGSVRSVMIVAPSNETGELVFSPEYGVNAGVISKLPDLRKGTVHAWFYFGKQAPKASFMVYNTKWNGSNKSGAVDFIFEDKGNGWYYGSIPTSLLENYYEGDGAQIIRMVLTIPAGYTVYVDGLMNDPNEEYVSKFDPDDLFASGIFTTEGMKSGNGYDVVTDVTNQSADAITLWAKDKAGWPKVGISFPTPVDISAYTNLNIDVKKALSGSKWVGLYLDYLDADGKRQRAAVGTDFTSDDWESISIPLAKFAKADLTKVMGIMVCANFDDGFVSGVENRFWYDNLSLAVVEPPPTPENPIAVEEDDDLISGTYTATAVVQGCSGAIKVAADDLGQSTGNSMLLMWANTPSGWPKAIFLFDAVQDWSNVEYLTLDTKILNTHPWVSVELINQLEDGTFTYSKGGAFDTAAGTWNTKQIAISSFTGVDITKVCGIRINVNLQEELVEGELAQVYVDNVYAVEKVVLPEDRNDLLADAQYVWGSFSGTDYTYDSQCQQVNGDGSVRSWGFAAAATASGWPKAQLLLKESYDMTNMKLVFDVKFENARQWVRVKLDNSDYQAVISKMDASPNGTGWQTVELKLSDAALEEGADLTDIRLITFNFDFEANAGQERAVYIDNVRLVPDEPEEPTEPEQPTKPEEPTEPEETEGTKDTDLLATSELTYTSVSEATKLEALLQSDVTNGSEQALKIGVLGDGYFQWPKVTLALTNGVSADTESFTVDVERTCSDWNFRVEFLDSNDAVLGNHLIGTGETGWQTHTFKLSEMSVDALTAEEVTKIVKVRFSLYFADNLNAGNAIYIDNASFIQAKNTDLIDTSVIAYTSVSEDTKLEALLQEEVTNSSDQALKIGVLGDGYFQWPKATLTLAESVPEGMDSFTVDVERTCSDRNFRVEFLDGNDAVLGNHLIGTGETGWQTHTFKLSEMSVDALTAEEVTKIAKIRFSLYFATGLKAGDAMYIDNAAFEKAVSTDLIDSSAIVYTRVSDEKKLEASLQGDVTNGSEQAIKVAILGGGYERWPIITMTLAEAVSADSNYFTVDVERTCSDWNFRVEFLDDSGTVLGNHLIGTGENGWQTHTFKLSEMSVNAVDSTEVAKIAKVRFTLYLLDGLSAGDAMYIDNASFLTK